jgi:hypothetical protein
VYFTLSLSFISYAVGGLCLTVKNSVSEEDAMCMARLRNAAGNANSPRRSEGCRWYEIQFAIIAKLQPYLDAPRRLHPRLQAQRTNPVAKRRHEAEVLNDMALCDLFQGHLPTAGERQHAPEAGDALVYALRVMTKKPMASIVNVR